MAVEVFIRGVPTTISRPKVVKDDGREVMGLAVRIGKGRRYEVRVTRALRGSVELDTLIHELMHVAFWDMDEWAIEEAASSIADALWEIGYRKTGD